jgi:hypothetical protein
MIEPPAARSTGALSGSSRLSEAAFEISQLLSRFYAALDGRDYRSVADCFASDGEWRRLGKALQGPSEVFDALAQRNPHLVTHHLVGNCHFKMLAHDRVGVRFLLTVFQSEAEAAVGAERHAPSPRVGFADAELTRASGDWLILSMQIRTPTFVAGK